MKELMQRNKQKSKTIVLARSRMLECGKNFKGTMNEVCPECRKTDDEHHRLNECRQWKDTNYADKSTNVNFNDIFSDSDYVLDEIIEKIETVWETKYANGKMKRH